MTNSNPQAFAAIDIGSNTFRLMVADQAVMPHPTPWHIIAYTHRIIRLGEGLHASGKLCDAAMLRAIQAFHAFADILKEHNIAADRTYAVATAAIREASNGEAFCAQVEAETGIQIHIIHGDIEANSSLAGSAAVLPKASRDNFLLFDIGGGSTEFVRAKHSCCLDAISRKLGVVRLVEAHLQSNPPSPHDYAQMKATCRQHLTDVEQHWQQTSGHIRPPKEMVGTAGTVTTLAAIDLNMVTYDANKINNHCITYARFMELKQQLLDMTLQERQAMPAIEDGRADLMIAGLAIIESIFDHWHYTSMRVVDAGLLEGAWLKISSQ